MTAETDDIPLLVARATPVPRQFRLVGGIHSFAMALFVGAFALIALKFGADAARGASGDGGNLRFAAAWSAVATAAAFVALLVLHYRALIAARSRTAYLVFPDRVEVRRDGSARPRRVIPLARAIAVESWTGPLIRPLGLATLTVVEEGPPDAAGRRRHVFHPLPNVAEPEAAAEAIRSRLGGPTPSG